MVVFVAAALVLVTGCSFGFHRRRRLSGPRLPAQPETRRL